MFETFKISFSVKLGSFGDFCKISKNTSCLPVLVTDCADYYNNPYFLPFLLITFNIMIQESLHPWQLPAARLLKQR